MGKTIGFTYDLKSDHPERKGLPDDAYAELDREDTIEFVQKVIESGGHRVVRIGHAKNLLKRINDNDLDVDIVFNLCEGIRTRNRESEVPVILDLIREIKDQKDKTILLVEHKMDVVRSLADRIVVLHQGELVADGTPAEVIASPVVQEAYLGVPING